MNTLILFYKGFVLHLHTGFSRELLKCSSLASLCYVMTLSPEVVTRNRTFPVPRISLIMPVFNQQNKISFSLEKIKQAVESAFSDYELIVVDDGSTDNTLTILRDITSTD